MNGFQIGKVEGRWTNFVPPIQGGKFRHYLGDSAEPSSDTEDEQTTSSQDSSRPSTPIFDVEDYKTGGIRRRRSESTSVSSASSVSPLETSNADPSFTPKPFFLDARTQEEIVLDVVKSRFA